MRRSCSGSGLLKGGSLPPTLPAAPSCASAKLRAASTFGYFPVPPTATHRTSCISCQSAERKEGHYRGFLWVLAGCPCALRANFMPPQLSRPTDTGLCRAAHVSCVSFVSLNTRNCWALISRSLGFHALFPVRLHRGKIASNIATSISSPRHYDLACWTGTRRILLLNHWSRGIS